MTERDLTRVLTQSVQDVHLSDAARRSIRLATKEERTVKMKRFAAILLVTVLALSTTAGVAAGLGMFDLLAQKMGQEVLPQATEIVQNNMAIAENEYATYHVRQAAYDGQCAVIMVDVKPKRNDILLVDETCVPEEDLIAWYIPELQGSTQTILEYAVEHEQTVVYATMRNSFNGECMVIDSWDNGTLTLMMSFNATDDILPLTFDFTALPCHANGIWTGERASASAEIELTAAAPLWQISSEQTFDLPEYGVRIEGMTVIGTVLQSYYEMKYTITDIEKTDQPHRIELLDAQGNPLPRGVLGVGGSDLLKENGQLVTWHGGFGPTAEAPAQLMLRFVSYEAVAPSQVILDLK